MAVMTTLLTWNEILKSAWLWKVIKTFYYLIHHQFTEINDWHKRAGEKGRRLFLLNLYSLLNIFLSLFPFHSFSRSCHFKIYTQNFKFYIFKRMHLKWGSGQFFPTISVNWERRGKKESEKMKHISHHNSINSNPSREEKKMLWAA